MTKIINKTMLQILPALSQILRINPSYLLVLPIFDQIHLEIMTSKGNYVPVTLYQYLNWCGINNSYLFRGMNYDKLWIKQSKSNPYPGLKYIEWIKSPTGHKDLTSILKSICPIEQFNTPTHIYYGLEIPHKYIEDIQLLLAGRYSKVSDDYLKRGWSRTRLIYNDGSIASLISKLDLGRKIILRDDDLKYVMSQMLDANLDNKELFKAINIKDETLT